MGEEGSFDAYMAKMQAAVTCSLCNKAFTKPHTFQTCGHTFCYDCVSAKLEGPGIIRSECPTCHEPGWKKDLMPNRQVVATMEAFTALKASLPQGVRCAAAAAAAAAEAGAELVPPSRRGSTVKPPTGGGRSAKQQPRRGRSVPAEASAALQEVPGQQPQQPQQGSEPAARAADEQQRAAGSQQAARCSGGAASPGAAPSESVPMLYDSDWEERVLALPPPRPEEIPALEAEIELLRRALALCGELPCLGGQGDEAAGAAGAAGGAAAAAGEAAAWAEEGGVQPTPDDLGPPLSGVGSEQQADVVVPDTQEELPVLPHVAAAAAPAAAAAAATAAEAAAAAAAGQQAAEAAPLQERKRQLAAQQAPQAEEGGDEEESPRMSGRNRKRRKGQSGRARSQAGALPGSSSLAAPSRSAPQPPPQAAAPLPDAGGGSGSDDDFKPTGPAGRLMQQQQPQQQLQRSGRQPEAQLQPEAQPQRPARNVREQREQKLARQFEDAEAAFAPALRPQQQQPGHEQQQQAQPPQEAQQPSQHAQQVPTQPAKRPSAASLRKGDAVEVVWANDTGQMQAYPGRIVSSRGGGGKKRGGKGRRGGAAAAAAAAGRLEHLVRYLDGDEEWHCLEEDQWRRLSPAEWHAAQLRHAQDSSGSGSGSERSARQRSGSVQRSGGGRSPASVAAGSGGEASTGSGEAAAPAAAQQQQQKASPLQPQQDEQLEQQQQAPSPAGAGCAGGTDHDMAGADSTAAVSLAPAAAPPVPAAAPAVALAPGAADPYAFVSNTEAVHGDASVVLLAAPAAQQRRPLAPVRVQPKVPPPKFNAPRLQQPAAQKRQQEPEPEPEPAWLQEGSSMGQQPRSAAAAAAGVQQFARKRPKVAEGTDSGPAAAAAVDEAAEAAVPPPAAAAPPAEAEMRTQDAADALFGMLHCEQPEAAAGFVTASQLFAGLPPPAKQQLQQQQQQREQQQQQQQQDPWVFAGSEDPGPQRAAGPAGRRGGAPDADPRQRRLRDLLVGITPSQQPSSWQPDSQQADGDDSQSAAAEAVAAGGGGGGSRGAAGRPPCLVMAVANNETQQSMLRLQAQVPGLLLEETVTGRTTHVLVQVDAHGCATNRSVQYLLALAHGCWVVTHQWVEACLAAGQLVDEAAYEAKGPPEELHAPRAARQRRAHGRPGLFAGRRVHIVCDSRQPGGGSAGRATPANVAAMVAAQGGSVVARLGASASPSPDGGSLVVWMCSGALPALQAAAKQAKRRFQGRTPVHVKWVYDSVGRGACQRPSDYAFSEACPVPPALRGGGASQAGS